MRDTELAELVFTNGICTPEASYLSPDDDNGSTYFNIGLPVWIDIWDVFFWLFIASVTIVVALVGLQNAPTIFNWGCDFIQQIKALYRCWRRRSVDTLNVDHVIQTELEEEKFSLYWKLKDYTKMSVKQSKVHSPVIIGGEQSRHSWHLEVVFNSEFQYKIYLQVFLVLDKLGKGLKTQTIRARYQISFLDSLGRAFKGLDYFSKEAKIFQLGRGCGIQNYILSSEVHRVLVDDALNLHCVVWLEGEVKNSALKGVDAEHNFSEQEMKVKGSTILAKDLGKFFNESVNTDFTISTNSSTTPLKTRRSILTARSPVFAKMLSANMQESLKNSLNIEDFGEETVKGMLEWIYTGTTEIVSERAELLLQIAEKYELEGLKEDCEGYLAQKLCVENASNMLLLGHLYNAPYLKRRSTEFIIINKKEVVKTTGFKELSMESIYTGVFFGLFLADHQ